MRTVKVALISDHASQGGAAIACNRLAVALSAAGATVRRFSLDRGPRPGLGAGVSFAPEPSGRRTTGLVQALDAFGCTSAARALRIRDAARVLPAALAAWKPDVINLHNLHGFDARWHTVEAVARVAPIVWTLHDMWSFTGRCSYAFDCRRFETGCNAECPTPGEYPAVAPHLIAREWRRRANFLRTHPETAAVTPSRWLATEAARGLWRGHLVETIGNSLDPAIYAPLEQAAARAALGLPRRDRPALLFVADHLTERRKGGPLVAPALAECGRELEVWTLGHGEFDGLPPNIRRRSLGYVTDERMKALVYCAADALIHPAPVDNFPNTIAEALMCGTPVVAFRVGGIPEMLPTAECGRLVESIDARALGQALGEAVAPEPLRFEQKLNIHAAVSPLFDPARQAAAYLDLFTRSLRNPAPP